MSYVVAVDVGGTNVRVALGNSNGRIIAHLSEKADKRSGPSGLSQQIARMIHSIKNGAEIRSIGIGSAGPLDLKKGSITNSPHLRYPRIPLVRPLKREFDVPIFLANDCVAAVVAERTIGQGKSCDNLVYVTISSGIGAGVFVDGHLLIGKDGNAHEVGHITIDHTGGLKCGCGKLGHWEAYCGGANASNFIRYQLESKLHTAIEDSRLYSVARGDLDSLTSEDLFESAKAGDNLALDIVEEMGRLNAIGFANIASAYDPDLITVGGAVALADAKLTINPIKRLIREYSINRIPPVRATGLGEDIVLRGALLLSRERYLCRRA